MYYRGETVCMKDIVLNVVFRICQRIVMKFLRRKNFFKEIIGLSPKGKFLQRNNRSSYNSYNFFYDAVNTIRSSITIDACNNRCANTYLSLPVFSQAPLQAFPIIQCKFLACNFLCNFLA